ncbi:MAG: TIGR00269 family protein [Candidatus Thorarchaeota archaeon]|nr:MAG: TIGR00269 family protein [Candidatus Thorarchaeota archaeon]RLI60148.1 MAG: TIGR00269 family protein [Candidatus Thorarchaeota archaeon]
MSSECSKCGKKAVYLRRYTAEKLCESCLVDTTIDRVRRAINRHQMLKEDDRIAVAISGGKDSAVLLHILQQIEERFPESEIVPVTIDEGIHGYRDQALESARNLSTSLGLDLQVFSFKDLFGHTLDSIIASREGISLGACSYCGVFRRRALNVAAERLGADVIATGHNMDDEAQTVLMNVLRGDSSRLARTNVKRNRSIEGLVPRVKPIMVLSERDIVAYSHVLDLPYHDVPCPYATEAYRNDVRHFLNEMEHKRPGTLITLLRSGEAISDAFQKISTGGTMGYCERCGSPSPSKVCKVCELLDKMEN